MNFHPLRRATDKPPGRRFRRSIYVLPSLFTALNMAFGYYAIWHTFMGSAAEPWHYDVAAKAIGFAVLFDGLDGKIARATNTTSDFGRELDSLADVITFGVAPAILGWVWGFRQVGSLNGHELRSVYDWVKTYERFWQHQLGRIKDRAERIEREKKQRKRTN